jgi:hypothetical protein
VRLVRDGHVVYRLHFIGRPDLDSKSFDNPKAYEVGESFSADGSRRYRDGRAGSRRG